MIRGGEVRLELSVSPDGVLVHGFLEARGCRQHIKGQVTISALCRGDPLACVFLVVQTLVVSLPKRVGFHLSHNLVGGHQIWHSLAGIHGLEAAHVRPGQHGQIDRVSERRNKCHQSR